VKFIILIVGAVLSLVFGCCVVASNNRKRNPAALTTTTAPGTKTEDLVPLGDVEAPGGNYAPEEPVPPPVYVPAAAQEESPLPGTAIPDASPLRAPSPPPASYPMHTAYPPPAASPFDDLSIPSLPFFAMVENERVQGVQRSTKRFGARHNDGSGAHGVTEYSIDVKIAWGGDHRRRLESSQTIPADSIGAEGVAGDRVGKRGGRLWKRAVCK
ncbi:hypothetical protein BDK51DRAFT_38242, partial [Blyttiomyces helicus]